MTDAVQINVFDPARLVRMASASCLGILFTVAALGSAPSVAAAEHEVVFGAYSSDKPSAMVAQVSPTLRALSKKILEMHGEKVTFRMQIVRGYKTGVDHLIDKKFDIMRLGPASYTMAKRKARQISVLAMESKNGKKTFNGVIAVHKDSPIQKVTELKGKSFAFGSKRSTLGRFFAQLVLTQSGVLADDLGGFKYLGRHDKVGRAVGSKLFDAGALEGTTFAKLVKKGVPIRALKIYTNSTRPWVAREGLNPKLVRMIREAMLNLSDKKATNDLRFDGFLPGQDSDYDLTRRAIEDNHKFFEGFTGFAPRQQSQR